MKLRIGDTANLKKGAGQEDAGARRRTKFGEAHARAANRRDSTIGELFEDRYRIDGELGRGGMGVVYTATHTRLGTKVALKVLPLQFALDEELRERFTREAQAAATIGHDNIVTITDLGVTTRDSLYLAMELLKGKTLFALLGDEGSLPWERVKHIVLQMCGALQAAHKKGITHRDIKPENVFIIEKNGNKEFVKILDFGLARLSDSRLTQVGVALGTAEYMSPEQAGAGKTVDHRADIYSLGIMMYEMLTGMVPFQGKDYWDTARMQVLAIPQPPSEINPSIPKDIEDIIMCAIDKDPEKRFQSMSDLENAILAVNEERTVVAKGGEDVPQTTEIIERTLRKKQPKLFIAVAAAAALATFVSIFLIRRPVQTDELKESTTVRERVETKPKRIIEPETVQQKRDVMLVFRTTPGGAPVFHNGKELGTTPLGIPFPRSDQTTSFTITLNGYLPQEVALTPNADLEVNRSLERKPRATKTSKGTKVKIVDPY